ncbi:hypothetical protein [Thermococcus gorgonarius]|uniref:Uncharacterized protein n=1 Tax=Thermococcus gorgonarius TaxID=71997 RepID=A0A2Z2M599_THEGO|nr:hypothetical protein [Thermococcus gorgonarius]ASJ00636.1 hypothetical protein A3K92_03680 [Thermococcus gorgonarius]
MKVVEIVRDARNLEDNTLKEYIKVLKKLKSAEYTDLRVLLLRMAIDTLFHKHIMEAIEKAYEEALDLINEFGYTSEDEVPEDAPRKQIESGLVIIPGLPALTLPFYGVLGSRIPPEEVLDELLSTMKDNVVIPPGEEKKIKETLRKFKEMSEKMKANYEKLETKAVHPIITAVARETRRNEEQHEAVLEKLIS